MNLLTRLILGCWLYLRRDRLPPADLNGAVLYFAFSSNMIERLFRERRHITPIKTRVARLDGFRPRFAVAGRRNSGAWARFVELLQGIHQITAGGSKPGVSDPAKIVEAPGEHVWDVLYRITQRNLIWLDSTEGVPDPHYRHLWTEAEDMRGRRRSCLTYMADGLEKDGNPSLRYLTLLREGASAYGLPEPYVLLLNNVKHAD